MACLWLCASNLNKSAHEGAQRNKLCQLLNQSEKQKIDIIETTGDGDKYLSNDGTYKLVSGSVEVDNETIKKDQNNKLKAVGGAD